MNIVITGASGFVGQNLDACLNEHGHHITRLSLRNNNWKLEPGADAIIHLAGKAHDTSNTSFADAYFEINRDLTQQLFDAFLESGIRDFIYFSSVKAAADTVKTEALTESVVPDPQTPYGQSKLQAEQYILGQPLPDGKRVFIIRPCMIHGPGNKGNLNLLYKFVSKGIPYPLAAFENRRSFLSIDNLCFAMQEILERDTVASGVYNLADDDTLSTNDVVRIIATVIGKRPRLLSVPQGWLKIAAKAGDRLSLPLNSERLKKLTESYIVSNQKIKQALGIPSFPVSAKEGLIKTIRSFQNT